MSPLGGELGGMSGRARAALLLLVVLVSRAGAALADAPPAVPMAVQDQQRFTAWLFGGATDPLHRQGFCGEQVGDTFFLNVATSPVSKAGCVVPAGVPLLTMPAGAWAWAPTHGRTPDELLTVRDWLFSDLRDVAVTIDGAALDLTEGFADAGFYAVRADPGSFLSGVTVTPDNPAGLTGAIFTSVGFAIRIPPLPPGPHLIELNAVFPPAAHLHATYEVTVANPGWLLDR